MSLHSLSPGLEVAVNGVGDGGSEGGVACAQACHPTAMGNATAQQATPFTLSFNSPPLGTANPWAQKSTLDLVRSFQGSFT